MLVLTVLTANLIVASLSFAPLMPPELLHAREEQSWWSQLIKVENWKNKKYVIWSLAIPSALFGYFVPYIHIVQFVKDILPDSNGKSLLTCIAITSGLGRFIFGFIADLPRVNRILLQQISFVSIGQDRQYKSCAFGPVSNFKEIP